MSEEALSRIANFKFGFYQSSPHSIWHRLPVSRRAAVFILLFIGRLGEIRVVLTKRSSKLRSFPGHISLPGGKSDTGLESEWQTARREMEEEIGLSSSNDHLSQNYGFTIEHLNVLPSYLSRTFSAVRPCVGFMKFSDKLSEKDLIQNLKVNLNPGESSDVFSCPLKDFLYPVVEEEPLESTDRQSFHMKWGGIPHFMRSYCFPQMVPNEAEWLKDIRDLSETDVSEEDLEELERETANADKQTSAKKAKLSEWGRLGTRRSSETNEKIYDVWGLTAAMLHDLAVLMYTAKPPAVIGEEELIYSVWKFGKQMRDRARSEEERKLISSKSIAGEYGFNDLLPRTEFLRLKRIYKV